jgi:long-chain acyl-CoA synthetase
MKRTVLRMLDEAAEKWTTAPYALRKGDGGWIPLSFSAARQRAREFAAWLLKNGTKKGEAFAILAEGSPSWIVAEFGVLMAGGVSVPLSIKLMEEEIPFRLNHSEARSILTTKNQLKKVLGSLRGVQARDITIIYLDDDPEDARAVAAAMGVEGSRVISFDEACAEGRAVLPSLDGQLEKVIASIEEDDTVTICYTSGTTGNPKGIMLTHLNYWANCHDAVDAFAIPAGWRSLIILPVDHSFAHTAGLYTALVCGLVLYFVDSRGGGIGTLRNIPINMVESASHLLFTVPSLSGNIMKKIEAGVLEKGGLIEKLFSAGIRAGIAWHGDGFTRPPLASRLKAALPYAAARVIVFGAIRKKVFGGAIQFCVGGGALLDVKQQEFFAALGVPIYQGYGLTEAAPIISANMPTRHRFGTSGPVLPSIQVRIVKADGTEAEPGETAELVIRGENVMKGYFKNPEATAKALRGGWLYTGDLAYLDPDGFLVVVGREKALLIAEDGEKYSPEAIEEAIAFSTNVIDQVMAWCDHRKYTTALVSLDVARVERFIKNSAIDRAEALLSHLGAELTKFRSDPKAPKVQAAWVPSVFQIVAEAFNEKNGTVNSNAKMVRHKVAEVHADLLEYAYTKEGSKTDNPRNLQALRTLFKLK